MLRMKFSSAPDAQGALWRHITTLAWAVIWYLATMYTHGGRNISLSPIIYHFLEDVDGTFERLTTVAADGHLFIGQPGGGTCGINVVCLLAMTSWAGGLLRRTVPCRTVMATREQRWPSFAHERQSREQEALFVSPQTTVKRVGGSLCRSWWLRLWQTSQGMTVKRARHFLCRRMVSIGLTFERARRVSGTQQEHSFSKSQSWLSTIKHGHQMEWSWMEEEQKALC